MIKFLILAALMFLAACQIQESGETVVAPPTVVPDGECTQDSDCATAGCSGQLCVPVDGADKIITTCEYREEYSCLQFSTCGCIDGECGWARYDEYASCLDDIAKNK